MAIVDKLKGEVLHMENNTLNKLMMYIRPLFQYPFKPIDLAYLQRYLSKPFNEYLNSDNSNEARRKYDKISQLGLNDVQSRMVDAFYNFNLRKLDIWETACLVFRSYDLQNNPFSINKVAKWTKYMNRSGQSNVTYYDIQDMYIAVVFSAGGFAYIYSAHSVGILGLELLKSAAKNGNGLGTYIQRFCRKSYDKKISLREFA